MIFYYIRHGDPIYSPDSLTPLGERQAEAVGRRLAAHGIDRIFASSSRRAQLTAKPLAEMLHKEMTILDWANEGHFWREAALDHTDGKRYWINGHPDYVELFNSDEVRSLGDNWASHPRIAATMLPAGYARIRRETDALMLSLGYRRDPEKHVYIEEQKNDERIALFAHAGFGTGFLSCLLDIPYPEFALHTDMSHSGVTVIQFTSCGKGLVPRIMSYNDLSHIYAENLPMKYNNGRYI